MFGGLIVLDPLRRKIRRLFLNQCTDIVKIGQMLKVERCHLHALLAGLLDQSLVLEKLERMRYGLPGHPQMLSQHPLPNTLARLELSSGDQVQQSFIDLVDVGSVFNHVVL